MMKPIKILVLVMLFGCYSQKGKVHDPVKVDKRVERYIEKHILPDDIVVQITSNFSVNTYVTCLSNNRCKTTVFHFERIIFSTDTVDFFDKKKLLLEIQKLMTSSLSNDTSNYDCIDRYQFFNGKKKLGQLSIDFTKLNSIQFSKFTEFRKLDSYIRKCGRANY